MSMPRSLTILCVTAWLGCCLDLVAAAGAGSPALRAHPAGMLVGWAINYASWAAVSLIPVSGLALIRQVPSRYRTMRRALMAGGFCVLWPAAFLYCVSWITYARTAHFISLEGMAFLRHDLAQLVQHVLQVEAVHVYLVVTASLALVCALGWAGTWLMRRVPAPTLRAARALSLTWAYIGLVAGLILARHSAAFQAAEPSRRTSLGYVMDDLRRTAHGHVGPFTGLAFESAARISHRRAMTGIVGYESGVLLQMPREAPYPPDVAIRVREVLDPALPATEIRRALTAKPKQIIPMEEYLQRIPPGAASRMNIIVVLVESLRADRLRALGATRDVMPNVDRLAQRSLVFAEAYTQSSHSDYADLCTLSSNYPLRSLTHHFYERITYPRVLIYDVLKPLGYRTAIFSSQNERWGGMLNFLDTGGLDHLFHSETFSGRTYLSRHDPAGRYWPRFQLHAGKVDDRDTMEAALTWLREQPGQPFFMYMNLQGSHFPYLIPKDVPPLYEPAELTFPLHHTAYPAWAIPVMQNRYDNSLHHIDSLLAKLFRYLETSGLRERTIIVVTGDTGQAFYEHGHVMHAGPLWNEVLHVPLVIHAPRLASKVVRSAVQHIDIPPTLLALLGLPPHPAFQGLNLLESPASGRPPVFALAQKPWTFESAVIMDGLKLVQDWRGPYRFFDLRNDPGERVDLIDQPSEELRRLQHRLKLWHALQLTYYMTPEIHQRFFPPSGDQIESLLEGMP